MQTKHSFIDFQTKVPFLQDIPQSIASGLCADEFYYPDELVAMARQELEKLFGHYVMTYKAGVFRKDVALSAHLCAQYKGATLTEEQRELLKAYEKAFADKKVRFVVYEKPLKKITFREGPFFQ